MQLALWEIKPNWDLRTWALADSIGQQVVDALIKNGVIAKEKKEKGNAESE